MKKLSSLFIAATLSAASFVTFAQTVPNAVGPDNGELKWNGAINKACNLAGFVDGTVVPNLNQTKLSSTLSGGAVAQVDARTNADGYTLVFGTPILMKDGQDVSYLANSIAVSPIGSGRLLNGTTIGNFGATNGNLVFTNGGFYHADVDADVSAAAGQAFPAGAYIVRVPVTCTAAK